MLSWIKSLFCREIHVHLHLDGKIDVGGHEFHVSHNSKVDRPHHDKMNDGIVPDLSQLKIPEVEFGNEVE